MKSGAKTYPLNREVLRQSLRKILIFSHLKNNKKRAVSRYNERIPHGKERTPCLTEYSSSMMKPRSQI